MQKSKVKSRRSNWKLESRNWKSEAGNGLPAGVDNYFTPKRVTTAHRPAEAGPLTTDF
jgi:hypothetical protein